MFGSTTISTNMNVFCRLYATTGQDLVLTGSTAKVSVVDVHASVVMSQKFKNPLSVAVSATYSFSMLAGSAICGFEMVREDGTKVEGIVKEKEEAKKEYQEAVSQGFTASLGAEETKDVFSISVGNILPSETVTINLRFLQPLTDDEKKDQLRFTFPRAYAQRYGAAPTAEAASATSAHQPFSLEMSIQQAGPIRSVACPSGHSISFEFGPPDGVTGVDISHFAKVTLNEPTGFLTQDVLVVISAANLDAPRCFIEPHPSPNHLTTAVGLTFVPRFKLPDIQGGMEYIFLIDRSGSMQGDRIKLVREALVVLLRGLPTKDTSFNLVSFGSRCDKLWEKSKRYTQDSLDEATRHVDLMQANYGGTQIADALQTVFSSLESPLPKPVSLLLLTDGGAWDIDNCVRRTEAALAELPGKTKNFIRVFTVGIGSGVSSDTCDSIARAGGGIPVYVQQGEAMTGKCARLIRAARTPPVVDLRVFWPGTESPSREAVEEEEDDFELIQTDSPKIPPVTTKKKVNLFADDNDDMDVDELPVGPPTQPIITLPPPSPVQQAPVSIPSLFPGTRTQIYAILAESRFPKASHLPNSIKVSGRVLTTGDEVELDVPVAKLLLPSAKAKRDEIVEPPKPILHTLAAKALITDRETGNHSFPPSISSKWEAGKDEELKTAYIKEAIIRLGTTYGLTSKYTSFVAVDRREQTANQLGVIIPNTVIVVPAATTTPDLFSCLFGGSMNARVGGGSVMNMMAPAAPQSLSYFAAAPQPQHQQPPRGRFSQPLSSQAVAFGAPASAASFHPTSTTTTAFASSSPSSLQSNLFGSSAPPQVQAFGSSTTSLFGSSSSSQLFDAPAASAATFGSTNLFGSSPTPPHHPIPSDLFNSAPQGDHKKSGGGGGPMFSTHFSIGKETERDGQRRERESASPNISAGERLASIARLQSFDGGFKLSTSLLQLLKISVTTAHEAANKLTQLQSSLGGTADYADVGATLLAWKWLKVNAGEEAIDLVEKTEEYLKDRLGDDVRLDELVEKVNALIAFL